MDDVGAQTATGGQTSQFSWAEGNDLKLFGCKGKDSEVNPGWHVFLYPLRVIISTHTCTLLNSELNSVDHISELYSKNQPGYLHV